MSPNGLGPENDCAGEDQQQLYTTRGCYIRTVTASVQLENKFTGRKAQGAFLQDEVFCGKPPVVK
jgi:hypothetical protein